MQLEVMSETAWGAVWEIARWVAGSVLSPIPRLPSLGWQFRLLPSPIVPLELCWLLGRYQPLTWLCRLEQLMVMGSLILKEESGFRAFYHGLLRPYKHYLPVWKEVRRVSFPELACWPHCPLQVCLCLSLNWFLHYCPLA